MKMPRITCSLAIVIATCCLLNAGMVGNAVAQERAATGNALKVDRTVASVELITKTSRLLQFDYDVPSLVIDNQTIIRATPIATDQVLLTALKPGIATITVNDADNRTQTLDIVVKGDVRTLEMTLSQIYPSSNIKATALETGVVLTGTLARADDVAGAVEIASEYFPRVHNNLRLPDSQMIAIECQIYEVSRTKVRELGIEWSLLTSDINLQVDGAINPTQNIAFSVMNNGNTFNSFLQALEKRSLARLMDKPTLVTMNGRPAEFLEGGEIPFEINQGLGNITIQFRPFGTKLDVVPIVQSEGTVRLEVRAEISEPDTALSNTTGTPGFRVRRVNTGVDMKIGHTLALAGDIREETESEIRGVPYLMDLPGIGRMFSRVEEETSEVELIILLTPRFVGEVDPALMPVGGPGRNSVSPSSCQFYRDGVLEVPRCGPDCGSLPNQAQDPAPHGYGYGGGFAQGAQQGTQSKSPSTPAQPAGYNWQQQVPAQPSSGFGYPTQGAPAATPRTSNFSLKNLRRR